MANARTPHLTVADMMKQLDYNPDTGEFRWKPKPGLTRGERIFNSLRAGNVAGSLIEGGKRRGIRINGFQIMASRLAYAYMTGSWPPSDMDVDHINRNALDDRWCNLRLISHGQNMFNVSEARNNTSGYTGVYKRNSRKYPWEARISVDNKMLVLGKFVTKEAAAEAYNNAATKYRGEYARLNKIPRNPLDL